MKNLIANFTKQLEEALTIGRNAKLTSPSHPVSNVFISGLGGSGIGGTIVSELVAMDATVPVQVGKGYFIPAYVNKNTLVIISSYSGNTEETLNALELALQKQATVVCITSGGKVEEIARKNKLGLILIPGGMPPRSCLGYSLTQLFFILHAFHIIGDNALKQLSQAVELLKKEENNIIADAKALSDKLADKIPVIYSTTYFEGVAIRFRQQINENSKMLCWHHVLPEMNHNELVGWTTKNDDLAVVIFRDTEEYFRNVTRIEISKSVFSKYTSTVIEIPSKGNSAIEKAIYFIHLGDWISYFLAEKRGVDAIEIKVIDHLKSELAKV